MTATPPIHDVAIIGAGVVGCAIARELSRHGLTVVLIDAADDVAARTSKANSAILHTGFDAPPGSLEARLVRRGHGLLSKYAEDNDIPLMQVGGLVLAWSADDSRQLDDISNRARENSYDHTRRLSPEEVYAREPHLAQGVVAALDVPDEAVICPFTTPLALATEAVLNGVDLFLNTPIDRVDSLESGGWALGGGNRRLRARWLVNAAGLYADQVEAMIRPTDLRISPRRGQFVVFDKHAASRVSSILLGVPTPKTKGVLIAPTVFGNILLGPTAEDIGDKTDTRTTHSGISHLLSEGERILPGINDFEITSTYAGIRAVGPAGYQVDADRSLHYAWAHGIRSTGLTSSMAIAEYVVERMADAGLEIDEHRSPPPSFSLNLNYLGEDRPRTYQSGERIDLDPESGKVLCFCENVTLGDLEASMSSTIPPQSLEGVWRRTRATGGRCQGFYCRMAIHSWFETHPSNPGSGG